jgi:RNA polymerase sigma-70 factor, ECF subfamily
MVSGPSSERDLVLRLRAGDAAAFDRLYEAESPRIFAFLLRLCGRRDTAEDLAQETWLKLAKAAPGLREDTNPAALLFTIARNAFVSYRRWAMLDLSRLVAFGIETLQTRSHETLPDAVHERALQVEMLERALQSLPVTSREVLLLVGVEGLEQDEVARIVGISYEALRQRLHRARAQLAVALETMERTPAPLPSAARRGRRPEDPAKPGETA